jgi:tetratricopeptide (TPR) repeat protein
MDERPSDYASAPALTPAESPPWPDAPTLPGMPTLTSRLPAPRPLPRLAQPFSPAVTALLLAALLLVVALSYAGEELLAHGDWSAGVVAAAVACFFLAGATLLATALRSALGRRLAGTARSVALIVVLLVAGGAGMVLAGPLHAVQARSLERGGDWTTAIHEYQLAGETAPNAPDVARVYDEWGELYLRQGAYAQAVQRFTVVTTSYTRSGSGYDRAQRDLFATYSAWLRGHVPGVPYGAAISEFVAYRAAPSCDATCQSAAKALEAQARYQYGLQLSGQKLYRQAIQQFEVVQSQLAGSAYAAPAHAAAATAYYALGQQQLVSTCADAIPTFQMLAQRYSDTPEGRQAQAALAAPQRVTGTMVAFPTNPVPTIMLSRHADPATFSFSSDYITYPAANGTFVFTGVAQGAYNIATLRSTGNGIEETWYHDSVSGNLYTVHVGPLCPTDFGVYQYKSSAG